MLEEVKIELTEQCERMCVHCSSKAKKEDAISIPLPVVKDVLNEASSLGARSVVFTGGEATLYPSLIELVSHATSLGMKVKLYTMATPNKETIEYIQKLTFYGLKEMIYSTTYRLTRDQVVTKESLEAFFPKLLQETSIQLGVHHAVTKDTLGDIEDALQLFLSLPTNRTTHFSLLRYVPHGRGEETLELRKKMQKWTSLYGDKIRLGSPWNYLGIHHTPCTAAMDTMIVGFDGNVYPCDAMKYFDYLGSGGNIYQNSLETIYHSPYFESVRKTKELVGETCQACPEFDCCKGGCLGQKLVAFVDTEQFTFASYGKQALRTMKAFDTAEKKKLNGELGLVGELGEFLDSFKKYKTHDVDEEAKEKLRNNLIIEAGDILWYVAASLGSSYGLTFEDIGNHLFGRSSRQTITESLLEDCVKRRDPECLRVTSSREIPLKRLDETFDSSSYQFEDEWKNLMAIACRVLFVQTGEEAKEELCRFVTSLSFIVQGELHVSMEEVARRNIEKLKVRYEKGFDKQIATSRVTLLTDYKQEEVEKERPYQKHI